VGCEVLYDDFGDGGGVTTRVVGIRPPAMMSEVS
jgi:hypothetical protein